VGGSLDTAMCLHHHDPMDTFCLAGNRAVLEAAASFLSTRSRAATAAVAEVGTMGPGVVKSPTRSALKDALLIGSRTTAGPVCPMQPEESTLRSIVNPTGSARATPTCMPCSGVPLDGPLDGPVSPAPLSMPQPLVAVSVAPLANDPALEALLQQF
jgi:hypothetical protein